MALFPDRNTRTFAAVLLPVLMIAGLAVVEWHGRARAAEPGSASAASADRGAAAAGSRRSQGGGIVNGDFETGSLSGWTSVAPTATSTDVRHGGTYSARVGSTAPFLGDASISQTFTPPAGNGTLSFWYNTRCAGSVAKNWATATLRDNTTGTTTTPLAKTCVGDSGWRQITASVTAGHSYTITLIDHDDGNAFTPAYTYYDDVAVTGLTISKTSDLTSVAQGGTVRYTITVTNTGDLAYTGAAVTDPLGGVLDDATYNNDAAATSGTVAYTSPNLTWTGALAVDATATITYTVTVKRPDPGDRSMLNTVSSSTSGSSCPSGTGNTACTRQVAVQVLPGLTITKTSDVRSATQGGTVNYSITVTNSGEVAYTGAAFTDPLGGVLDDATYNNNAAATSGTVAFASPNLTWTGNLPIGQSATITYSVTVRNPDLGNRSLANTITSTSEGNNCAAGSGDDRCTTTVPVTLTFPLTITKLADAKSGGQGQKVGYTIKVTNSTALPVLGASFSDSLTGLLDDADYDNNAVATSGTATYSSPNLTWTGNVAANATVTITYTVTIHAPDTGNKILSNAITSITAGNNCTIGSGDPRCVETVTVSVLTLRTAADVPSATPGQVVRFTTTLTNAGQTPYFGISATFPTTDIFDDATYNGDETATSGRLTLTPTAITWTGDVPVGGTVTITGTVTINNPDIGNKLLRAVTSTAAQGSNCPAGGADPACAVNVPILVPRLTITKTADRAIARPGETVRYTITVGNTGEVAYPAANLTDSLADVLDEAAYNGDAAANVGTVSYTSPDLRWTGALAVTATATITYSVTVTGQGEDDVLTNTVVSTTMGGNCAAGSGDGACSASVSVLPYTVSLTGLTDQFTLAGLPNSTVQQNDAVTMTVTSDNPTGYGVSVQGTSAALEPAQPGNTDTIPIQDLQVRDSEVTQAFQPLSDTTPVSVYSQNGPTPPEGRSIRNDYRVIVPFVRPDTYSADLTYVAMTS